MNSNCKNCKTQVAESYYFCPNCGKKLKEPPFKFSLGKTIGILLGSFLFPPFGLLPGIKYFLKNDVRAQAIGVLAIAITIISTGLFIILTANLIGRTMNTYNSILQLQGANTTQTNYQNQTDVLNQIKQLQNL